jgi:hypothetical protein
MKRQQISHFALSVRSCLRLPHAKTLSPLVPAAIALEQVSLAPSSRVLAMNCGTSSTSNYGKYPRNSSKVKFGYRSEGFGSYPNLPHAALCTR